MRLVRPLLLGAVLAAALASAAASREIVPAERREDPFDARLPPCDYPWVTGKIMVDFASRESQFWNSSLTIVGYENIRQVAWRPWGLDTIPRRFCTGMAVISDGKKRRIDYSVREDLGIVGATWGTEWCVSGLDRNYAFAPNCRMAQP